MTAPALYAENVGNAESLACPDCGGPIVHRVRYIGGQGLVGVDTCEASTVAPWLPSELRFACGAPNAEGAAFLAWYDGVIAAERAPCPFCFAPIDGPGLAHLDCWDREQAWLDAA